MAVRQLGVVAASALPASGRTLALAAVVDHLAKKSPRHNTKLLYIYWFIVEVRLAPTFSPGTVLHTICLATILSCSCAVFEVIFAALSH